MSLKGPGSGSSEDDRETRHPAPADPGPDSAVSGRQSAVSGRQSTARPAAADPGRGLRVRGRDPGAVRLPRQGEGRQGPALPVPGRGGRPLPGAGHPPAAPAPDHGRHRRPPRPPAPLPPPLHQGRHRTARRSRRPPRHPLRARHPPALHPGPARVRRRPLRAPRRRLQRTSLQPAPLDQLSAPPRDDARADPPRAHRHRRTPPAPARRTTRLPAGRYRPPGRPRRHQGPLPPQPRRRGHPVPVRRLPRAHRDALPRPRPRSPAPGVPLHRPRIPRDNGSEFINRRVAALLQALHIDEFTKSRPRRSNDNALVESKNGSVIASTSDTATSPAGMQNASTPSRSRSSPPT